MAVAVLGAPPLRRLNMVVMVGMLLMMAQLSMQLSLRNPLEGAVRKIKKNSGASIGLILTSDSNEEALIKSGLFVRSSSVKLSGRTFNVGTINGVSVIYVRCGSGPVNAAIAAQLLLDTFDNVVALVHSGSAGTVDDSLSIGDVVVLGQVANTGSLKWLKYKASGEELTKGGKLIFGDYNVPEAGNNYLQGLEYEPVQLYLPNGTKTAFWLHSDSNLLRVASSLKDLDLEKCVSSSNCMATTPKVLTNLRGSSADHLVYNAHYRSFLRNKFKASIVDQETATTAIVAKSNDKPFIAIRGVSNTAGGSSANSAFGALAYVNANTAVAEFIKLLGAASAEEGGYYKY